MLKKKKCFKELAGNDFVYYYELNLQRAAVFTFLPCRMVTMKCGIMYVMSKLNHDFDGMMGLQNCMDIMKSEPGPCTGTGLMSSDDGNEVVGIKVEEVADIKVEEDPEPATSSLIKTEPAVSCCLYMCVQCYAHYTDPELFNLNLGL